MTTFGDPVYQMGGVPVGSLLTQGKVLHVKPSSGLDAQDGLSPATALKTLSKALSLATANQNDIVLLYAESNTAASTFDMLAAALDWNKDGVHLIGVGAIPFIGSRAGLRNATTVATIEDLFTVSADNCLIANIAVFQGDVTSTATSPRAMVVSGTRNRIVNCQISGIGDTGNSMDTAGARSLAVTGAENYFKDCYIGLDTVLRATAQAEVEVGNIARTIFENCFFETYTSADGFLTVKYSAPDRFILFKNCTFHAVQNITSATGPAAAISAATSVNGDILIYGSSFFGYDNVAAANNSKILVSSYATPAADAALGGGLTIS